MKYADGTRMVAQGDVLLVPYHGPIPEDAIPEPVDPKHGVVLAYGEVTGSAHALDEALAQVLTSPACRLLTVGGEAASLRHAKHPPITLAPNTVWTVVRQVEEVEGVALRVAD